MIRRGLPRLASLVIASGTLLSPCVAVESEGPPDPLQVPGSNEEMMEEQQEEVREESNL